MFASGVWRLERLDSDYRLAGIAVMSPPAPSGSPADLPAQKLRPKLQKKIVKEPVQPTKPLPQQVAAAPTPAGEQGNGKGDRTGDGDDPDGNPDGEPDDKGTCMTPPCGEREQATPPVTPPKPPGVPKTIAPTVLQSLRIAGETQIHPSNPTKNRMLRDGNPQVSGIVKVCISKVGTISDVSLIRSTKYGDFDQQLLGAVRGWRYRPHTIDGEAVPVCAMVSFVYSIK